jgi:hypothetical protein
MPGRQFSANWIHSWNDTIAVLSKAGHSWVYSMQYDPVVYYARNRILGGNNTLGKIQKPFNGAIEYDFMFWIDSDMVWKGEDVLKLIDMAVPVATGCYLMQDNNNYAMVEQLDYSLLATQGTFKFIDKATMATKTAPFQVNYAGFGFMCIAAGIMERLEYPWFKPRWVNFDNFTDFTSEDVSFCWDMADNNIKIMANPDVRIGHEKSLILK